MKNKLTTILFLIASGRVIALENNITLTKSLPQSVILSSLSSPYVESSLKILKKVTLTLLANYATLVASDRFGSFMATKCPVDPEDLKTLNYHCPIIELKTERNINEFKTYYPKNKNPYIAFVRKNIGIPLQMTNGTAVLLIPGVGYVDFNPISRRYLHVTLNCAAISAFFNGHHKTGLTCLALSGYAAISYHRIENAIITTMLDDLHSKLSTESNQLARY